MTPTVKPAIRSEDREEWLHEENPVIKETQREITSSFGAVVSFCVGAGVGAGVGDVAGGVNVVEKDP